MKNRIIDELKSLTNGRNPTSTKSDDANQLTDQMANQAKQLQKQAEKIIASYPVAALSVAVVAGLALGWWVKRK